MKFFISSFLIFTLFLSIAAIPEADPLSKSADLTFIGNGHLNVEEFLALTPKKIREKPGQRLNLKQVIVLKRAQKIIRQGLEQNTSGSGKSQVTALFMAIFLGFIGVHRFYLGYPLYGVLMILIFGLCGIGALIDLILIATGELQPKY